MERGGYGSVYRAIFNDPDFQLLSSASRLVLLTCRLSKNNIAIFRYYIGELCEQTGLTQKQVEQSLEELSTRPIDDPWMTLDKTLIWVRKGLRYDPHFRVSDPKHLKNIQTILQSLPKSTVIEDFCKFYNLTNPFEGSSMSLRRPFEGSSMGHRSKEKEKEKEKEGREPRAETVVSLSADNREWLGITESLKQDWAKAYPAVDVTVELNRMACYIQANPNKRKVNWQSFIVRWLARTQDKGGTKNGQLFPTVIQQPKKWHNPRTQEILEQKPRLKNE